MYDSHNLPMQHHEGFLQDARWVDSTPYTAEMISFFTTYFAPVLLRWRFCHEIYYKHFVKLVGLICTCLHFSTKSEEVDELRGGFIDWVEEYEL